MTRPDIEQIRARAVHHQVTQADAYALLAAIDEKEHIIRNSGRIKHVLDLEAQRDAVLALHTSDDKGLCDECYQDSPCETVRALT